MIDPVSHSAPDPWTLAMRRGDFEAAWRVCDEVLAQRRGVDCTQWPRHLQYIWNGSPLADRCVLVRCYHGLGDTLQFVRLLPALRARARRVILWVQPALMELLANIPGADVLLPLHDGAPDVDYEVDIELMELPHALRLQCSDLPFDIPYIYVEPATRPAADKLRVGLVWRGGDWDERRSLPDASVRRWSQLEHVEWCALQYPAVDPPFPMINLACKDVRRLAARMQTLDLIVSVDTMNAHLAGALGLPVWTLLPYECDWRWMCEREDSPWYPTMRLFRQPRPSDWPSVCDAVAMRLQSLAATRTRVTRALDIRSGGCRASSS